MIKKLWHDFCLGGAVALALSLGCSDNQLATGTFYDPRVPDVLIMGGASDTSNISDTSDTANALAEVSHSELATTLEHQLIIDAQPLLPLQENFITETVLCAENEMQAEACATDIPCQGYRRRICEEGIWQEWSDCEPFQIISSSDLFVKPVISAQRIFTHGLNGTLDKDVYQINLSPDTLPNPVKLVGYTSRRPLRVSYNYLSGIHAGKFDKENCLVLDTASQEVVYDGICPQALDRGTIITQPAKNSLQMQELISGETADFTLQNFCLEFPVMSPGVVAFQAKPVVGTSCSTTASKFVGLWYPVSTSASLFLHPSDENHRDPLLHDQEMIFSEYNSTAGTLSIMHYDLTTGELNPLFSVPHPVGFLCPQNEIINYSNATRFADFNGTTLAFRTYSLLDCQTTSTGCSCSESFDIRLFNINSNEFAHLSSYLKNGFPHLPPGKPSLDGKNLVWAQGGDIYYCQLKEEWYNK